MMKSRLGYLMSGTRFEKPLELLLFAPKSGSTYQRHPGDNMIAAIERAASSPDNWTGSSTGEPVSNWVLKAAENPSTPTDILGRLAESCNVEVRMAVADNGSALLETVLMLAQDESVDLRYQLAENHNIHESVLKLLSEDSHPYVAHRAQKSLERLKAGAAIAVHPVLDFGTIVSITRFASTNALGSKLKQLVF